LRLRKQLTFIVDKFVKLKKIKRSTRALHILNFTANKTIDIELVAI